MDGQPQSGRDITVEAAAVLPQTDLHLSVVFASSWNVSTVFQEFESPLLTDYPDITMFCVPTSLAPVPVRIVNVITSAFTRVFQDTTVFHIPRHGLDLKIPNLLWLGMNRCKMPPVLRAS